MATGMSSGSSADDASAADTSKGIVMNGFSL
jgi:hypothetical protein